MYVFLEKNCTDWDTNTYQIYQNYIHSETCCINFELLETRPLSVILSK